ncbi:3-hydroxybutyrate dehydrogenase [Novosphingobium ginsenosidimutans]|uniref:3-hydroxybutyrate dehydrogenase n=1 Tax=Novosphingobium ginsenosidimutans TaxID=1176536 RepID=A0A5B8S4R7_9SPHN|nr:3-hydroxybutyrate dehydrogenase [Novosphingobium ginsenosidimutans]QEA16559.1 3-hydroxybutyrate dehydrogenase [Novosphingobium ginsenosidimutans]
MFLKGKRALVTGSTSGIGLAIARAMYAEGAEVILSGFGSDEEIAALSAEMNARHVAADLMTAAGVEALMSGAGEVDILVNNAGMQHVAPVDEFPVDKWDAIVALNLSAVFHACRLAVPGMKARGWGRIISTASAHSLVASPFKAPYVATKHAVAGFTKSLALELATSGVTANCISPGYVWTALIENQIPDTMKTRNLSREAVINDVLLAKQPTKKFVQPDEVAALAVFLCRPEAGNMTGANISMDGGWTAE